MPQKKDGLQQITQELQGLEMNYRDLQRRYNALMEDNERFKVGKDVSVLRRYPVQNIVATLEKLRAAENEDDPTRRAVSGEVYSRSVLYDVANYIEHVSHDVELAMVLRQVSASLDVCFKRDAIDHSAKLAELGEMIEKALGHEES